MNISYLGIGQVCATFKTTNAAKGKVVKVNGQNSVGKCSDGNDFCGVALYMCEGSCTVQVSGFAEVPYSGSAPAVGWTNLCADGSGGVKVASSGGRSYLVVNANTDKQTVTIKL